MNPVDTAFTALVRLWTGVTVRRGLPLRTGKPRVYFANHSSHLDLIVLRSVLESSAREKLRPAAAADYWGATATRRALAKRIFNAVLIERHHVTRDNHPVRLFADALREGADILIFPEGTRTESGEPLPFKSGLWHLAREVPDAEFIPVWLDNISRTLPKGEFLPLPLLCAVSFGDVLPCELREDRAEFLRIARDRFVALRNY